MIETFLKAKYWQLFLLSVGVPMGLQILLMGNMMAAIFNGPEPNIGLINHYFSLFPLIVFILMGVLCSWLYSIGVGLDSKIPRELKLNLGRFKMSLLVPMLYLLFLSIFMGTMMNDMIQSDGQPDSPIFGLIIPLHLFAMFCLFYCLYFVAKTLKTAELQKNVEFGDFAAEFFLIWCYPIGIWFIQPKLNKLMAP